MPPATAAAVVALQSVLQWQGDRTQFILLAGFNLFLASLATWFFHIRWRLLDDPFDRQLKHVFLPIAFHFGLLLVLEAAVEPKPLRDAFIILSWVITQTLAAAILIYTFRGGRAQGSASRALRTTGAVTLALLVWVFTSGPEPPWADAADVDGNDQIFALVDALFLLEWGFLSGEAPPDPGPFECGLDDSDDDIECEVAADACL